VSGITVTRVADANTPLQGAPWNLPMTQFTVTITRHVTGCGPTVKGAVEVLPAAGIAVDPDQRFVLTSNGHFSTSDIQANLAPTGISTSLNAQSADQTATVISNVIGTLAQVAVGVAAGAGLPQPRQPPPPPPTELCKKAIADAVKELYPAGGPKLKEKVDSDTAALAVATAKVSLLTAQAAAESTLKPKLVAALDAQAKAQATLTADQNALSKDLATTTDTQVVTWPRSAQDFVSAAYRLDDRVWSTWTEAGADSQSARDQFAVYLALYTFNTTSKMWAKPVAPAVADVTVGVPVRLANTARLRTCVGVKCDDTFGENDRPKPNQTSADFVVLQTGRMYVLPAKGGHFKSESAAVSLDPNGLPTSIETAEKTSAAATASGAAKDAATQFAALPASVRAAELAKTQAETNQVNANAALATAQATAGMQGQTSTLTAQTSLINAQEALNAAKQNVGLQQQAAGLTAQTSVLSAQAALATAQANSQVVDQTSALSAQASLINAQVAQLNAAAALAKAQVVTQ